MENKTSDAQIRASKKWNKKNKDKYKKIEVKFKVDSEQDLINLMEKQENKTDFIKSLLKDYLEKQS